MLENFFQLTAIPANQITGWYDPRLVVLSYIVAVLASYIALDITGRLRDINNTALTSTMWIFGGAFAMGAGIWSMHFIGMLAFSMAMPMEYNPGWTILSMIVAILASGFALSLLNAANLSLVKIILGGIVLGIAISAMHYTGMQAMTTTMTIHYLPVLFFISVLIGIIASQAALWLAIKSTQVIPKFRFRLKFVSAFIMGAAICGMHYTGMAAAVFTVKPNAMIADGALNPELLAISVAGVTLIILSIAFIASTYKESLNQQLLITARQAGMAEVASSVLHNVGNVLNSINVTSNLLQEKITQSKLSGLADVKSMIDSNLNNFGNFIQNDPQGKHLPKYISSLADYWHTEQAILEDEIKSLNKNVQHIRNIIATQQDMSRITEFEQIIAIDNLIEEAILISGVDNEKHAITIIKNFNHVKPIVIDKVKLLQILVNLLQNAKDALKGTSNPNKTLTLTIKDDIAFYYLHITDNGSGIHSENLSKIFAYGFTTKKHGHGFGLHMSAISARELGGSLHAESEGPGKGATFILKLPNNKS